MATGGLEDKPKSLQVLGVPTVLIQKLFVVSPEGPAGSGPLQVLVMAQTVINEKV